MKRLLKGIAPGLLLLTLATPGFAENRAGAVTISPFVGGYLLDYNQQEENRPIFGLRGGYNFTKSLGAEAMFGYSLTKKSPEFGSKETDLYRYGIDILYHFMPDSKFVPFVAIGGGGTNFNTPSTPSAKSHYAGLVSYGGGIKYFVADNVALRADVRHAVLIHDTGDNNFEYSAGLTFQFGGVKKAATPLQPCADCSQQKASVAATPVADTTAPTVTLTVPVNDAKAAPINQNIIAAFSEAMDPASITAETFSLTQDSTPVQGKVTQTASTATFTPARKLEKGKQYTAIITTGARDLAGNAMANNYMWKFKAFSAPVVVKVLSKLENSHFLFDRSDINENGKTILDHNIKIMKGDSAINVRVSGYTSAAGTAEYNQKLSERRAQAVKDYLVKTGGIDENRITAIGYGETSPSMFEAHPSNKLSDAAHANMRVIVEVIEE